MNAKGEAIYARFSAASAASAAADRAYNAGEIGKAAWKAARAECNSAMDQWRYWNNRNPA